MYHIHYLNKISPKGTELWGEDYTLTDDVAQAEGIRVRSAAMHDMDLPEGLLAVARAGAGVNNIPLDKCAEQGVVVFNTPGANARSVMELTLCGLLLASRDVTGGIEWVKSITGMENIAKQVEKGKSRFAGHEILGRKLGVIGLGAVGGPLANAARSLGMDVYGCDPFISIDAAWHLDSQIHRVRTREEIFGTCDMISLHTPLLDAIEQLNVHLVIHYDPVMTDDAEWSEMRGLTEKWVRQVDPRLTIHDFRMVRGAKQTKLVFDLTVPYDMTLSSGEVQQVMEKNLREQGKDYVTVIHLDREM